MYKTEGRRDLAYWKERYTSTQSKPHHLPLPYTMRAGTMSRHPTYYPFETDIRNWTPCANGFTHEPSIVSATNKALDKVYAKMGQTEALMVAWKERQKAIDLVTSNVRRLVTIARAVKRRDPKIVRRVMQRKPKGSDVAKTPASLWLEYHFAIVPTIHDIHSALGVLGHEFPVEDFSFSSGAKATDNKRMKKYSKHEISYETFVKLGGRIKAINPNMSLATQLGFGQPLSVAWEMTPFSWFVDYFGNVSQMIKNLEPRFPGITLEGTYTTVLQKGQATYVDAALYYNDELGNPRPQGYIIKFKGWDTQGVYMNRKLGLPSYQFETTSPLDLKGQQCSYIVAVLTGIFASFADQKFKK